MAGSEPPQAVAPTDLLRRVRQRPFAPFRLVVSEGGSYEIRHPDLLLVTRDSALIGLPATLEQDAYESDVRVDLLHVVRVELLAAGAGPQGGEG
jgi:hypothetical protein